MNSFKGRIIINPEDKNTTLSQHSFRDIFYELYPRLYSNSLKLVRDEFVAEEIVEDAMLALWERRDKIREIQDIKSYLYIVVRNGALAHLRKHRKESSQDITGIDIEDHDIYETYIIEEELHARLFGALKELPEKCREVFLLSCIYRMPYKEIGKELNISVNTVKSQRSRAIEILRGKLGNSSVILFFLNNIC
ncbi:RNA polymerase sigma factor [Sinomicrobium oceani]|uniref:RNA polymerase sigma factor n=1 Tax=Sinomicrobium oceani TaxID=1150368 RepID=UPI00227D12CB|nr:RNA polymerase sigma-70 factor [Sinomicrobium oceani]